MTTNAQNENWSEWIEWNGGDCPLPAGTGHEVRFRSGCTAERHPPDAWRWLHVGIDTDIIAYRHILSDAPEVTEEEEEAWQEKEGRLIGDPPSKYHVKIKGVWIDVYDILHAYKRTNPADQHAIKKMLMPGLRGHKGALEDRREAIQSLERAIELEESCAATQQS